MSTSTFNVSVEAHQWFRNGDHPDDGVGQPVTTPDSDVTFLRLEGNVVRFYRSPWTLGVATDPACGHIWDAHGWIDSGRDGQTVCPGDHILTVRTPNEVRYLRATS